MSPTIAGTIDALRGTPWEHCPMTFAEWRAGADDTPETLAYWRAFSLAIGAA